MIEDRLARGNRDKRRRNRPGSPAGPGPAPQKRSRDDLAREQLVPLRPDERPTAVTVAAALAAVLAVSNVAALVFGLDVEGSEPDAAPVLVFAAIMLFAAYGMWRLRYWAVLGFQTVLGFLIVLMSLLLLRAQNLLAVAVALAIIGSAGTLFWFLVKALARIQMPERQPPL